MGKQQDTLTLLGLCSIVWRRKLLVGAVTVAGVVVAVLLSYLVTPVYRAGVLLSPVVSGESRLASLPSQYADIAGVVGLDGGGTGNEELVAILGSREFTMRFIRDEGLMRVLFADAWDQERGEWRAAAGDTPTIWQAYELVDKTVRGVVVDEESGLVTLSIEWADPKLAAEWANAMVRHVNRHLRERAVEEGERGMAFLTAELQRTSVSEVREAIFRLMELELQRVMMANVRQEFGFRVLDPAMAPEKRVRPNRRLMVVAGLVLGALVSVTAGAWMEGRDHS